MLAVCVGGGWKLIPVHRRLSQEDWYKFKAKFEYILISRIL